MLEEYGIQKFDDIDVNYCKQLIANKEIQDWVSKIRRSKTQSSYKNGYAYGKSIQEYLQGFLSYLTETYDKKYEVDDLPVEFQAVKAIVFEVVALLYVEGVTAEQRYVSILQSIRTKNSMLYLCQGNERVYHYIACFEAGVSGEEFKFFCRYKTNPYTAMVEILELLTDCYDKNYRCLIKRVAYENTRSTVLEVVVEVLREIKQSKTEDELEQLISQIITYNQDKFVANSRHLLNAIYDKQMYYSKLLMKTQNSIFDLF